MNYSFYSCFTYFPLCNDAFCAILWDFFSLRSCRVLTMHRIVRLFNRNMFSGMCERIQLSAKFAHQKVLLCIIFFTDWTDLWQALVWNWRLTLAITVPYFVISHRMTAELLYNYTEENEIFHQISKWKEPTLTIAFSTPRNSMWSTINL